MQRSSLRRLVWLTMLTSMAGVLFCAPNKDSRADEPAKNSLPIAVLNLDRIMNPQTYAPLVKRLEPLKAEIAELDRKAKLRQVELETVTNQLRAAKAGTADFERLRLQQSKLQTELQLFIERERQEVQKKESAIYLDLYREIEAEVKEYCQAHGIKLVIRQQKEETDDAVTATSPQEILKLLNRPVVYHDGLDITDAIIKALADRAAGKQ